jgi:hypothetical protein
MEQKQKKMTEADSLGPWIEQPAALKSLYCSPGNKKKQLVLCNNYVLRHLGITINIKNTKFVKDLPMIDAQFRFNQCNSGHILIISFEATATEPIWTKLVRNGDPHSKLYRIVLNYIQDGHLY